MAGSKDEPSPDELRSKRQATMPIPPSPKKPSFLKRAFTSHSRNKSNTGSSTPTSQPRSPPSPQLQVEDSSSRPQSSASQTPSTISARPLPGNIGTGTSTPETQSPHPKAAPKVDSVTNSRPLSAVTQPRTEPADSPGASSTTFEHHDSEHTDTSSATEHDDSHVHDTLDGKDEADSSRSDSRTSGIRFQIDAAPITRLRHENSNSVQRRPSIFTRNAEHGLQGVNEGVGSKARRLSTAVPRDDLVVDECPLETHFNFVNRMHKKPIGEGGAATVQLMNSKTASEGKSKDKVFACKEFRPWEEENETQDEYQRKIKSEFAIAKSLEHPNIVQTYQLCYSEHLSKWNHVMEWCEYGDLNDNLTKGYFSMEDKNCMFKQLIRGVEYIHSRGIAHRDLKSENLLLNKDGCLKIADFGTSEVFSGTHPGFQRCRRPSIIAPDAPIRECDPGLVGSRPYMAPEVLEHEHPYDPRAIDIWSCGIVYITMIVVGTPWDAAQPSDRRYNAYAGTWDDFIAKYSPDYDFIKASEEEAGPMPAAARSQAWKKITIFEGSTAVGNIRALLFAMLNPDPKRRASAKQILDSKPLIEMPCCQQAGYSDDILKRQRKAMHVHCPPDKRKKGKSG
ncbi:hypothetical protein LTR86_004630 [Recurvomyces mirabilis]|nr:hypothetical protein LTR86_004630 [Recurvomyces mirabilis]